jgi:hypothetical protein
MIMGNDVIVPPQNFKNPSHWYCRVQEVKNCEFGADSNAITSIADFMEIRPTSRQLSSVSRRHQRHYEHAQIVMDNGVMVPSHDFENPSRYHQI